jgi:SAM-dependent methyltransferase
MNCFGPEYSHVYDLLYSNKNYDDEVLFVVNQIKYFSPKSKKLLDLGCGTGKHDMEFLKYQFEVTGVDQSEAMLQIANRNIEITSRSQNPNIKFINADIRNFNLNETFDTVVSLFHVMSYQVTDLDLASVFAGVGRHLQKGGIFIFDFWNGDAVRKHGLEDKDRIVSSNELDIIRKCQSRLLDNRNVLVQYETIINHKSSDKKSNFKEEHVMRYFFIDDLTKSASQHGFRLLHSASWLSNNPIDSDSWSAYAIFGI